MKQSENNDNRLTSEQPKLRKHGTIHNMTLTTASMITTGDSINTSYANAPGS